MLRYYLTLLIFYLGLVVCEYEYETKRFKVPLDRYAYHTSEIFSKRNLVNEYSWISLCSIHQHVQEKCLVDSEEYETKWFQVPLDHFGYHRSETFNIRYLVNEDNWDKGGGPIFFYTGNEGQVESFVKHTGFMRDIAPRYKAKLVFAEHRYYGQSLPFGNRSLDNENIGYLSSSQALADFAALINYLQDGQLKAKYPVIAFGGSYGGMLAAYLRMKYPHLAIGAIASSAPINMYPDMVPCEVFHNSVTTSFKIASATCVENIRRSWSELRKFLGFQNQTKSEWLKTNWKLCDPVKNSTDVQQLVDYLKTMYETLSMANYPFESDFLLSLPADPVRVVCLYLDKEMNGTNLLQAIGKVIQVYANYDGKTECIDYKDIETFGNLKANGWNYQACTEMIMPTCTNGKDDMFEAVPWNYTSYAENCHKKYGVYPRPDAAKIEYGGDRIKAASNIVFSNGLLDPWAGGGILDSISNTITAILIPNAAHHLDLMPSSPQDPDSVLIARDILRQNIDKWLRQFYEETSKRNQK